jgi:hypothetical protein
MKRFMNKKVAAIGLAAGLALGVAGGAFAYFVTTGSGSGTGTAGSASNVTLTQTSITYNGPGSTTNFLPGDTATVTWSATSAGNQQVGTVSLSNWSSNQAGCDPTDLPGSFTMIPVVENQDVPNGTTALSHSGNITFNDLGIDQSACEGATITFDYSS